MQIKRVIALAISEQPGRAAVKELVSESYRISLAYLQQKGRRGRLQANRFGLSMEDLALDCFADLFQRDSKGRFSQLASYFESVNWQDKSDSELYIALRRLIFSKVNDSLFGRYREADPNLAKIIRNVKLAAKADPELSLVRREAKLWLIVGRADAALSLYPLAPPEVLEAYLVSVLCNASSINEAVSAFPRFVESWPFYCKGYPLSHFAQTLRSAYIRLGEASWNQQEEELFMRGEVQEIIHLVIREVKAEMHRTYVSSKKVDLPTYKAYFRAVRDILVVEYTNSELPVDSYFDALKSYITDLSKETYRREHRQRLEYLAKIARARLLEYMKSTV